MEKLLNGARSIPAVVRFLEIAQIENSDPSNENLSKILRHYARLPYENLSKIIKLNQNWDQNHFRFPEEVISDHEQYQLGGTCFSLTFFLKTILDHLGYETDFLMADMRSGANSHCALILKQDDKEFLVDPGYLLSSPLDISSTNSDQGIYLSMESRQNQYSLWTPGGKQMKKRYTFIKTGTSVDQFIGHWENSFHLMTMHGICLSKRDKNGFVYLHNHYIKREGNDLIFKGKFNEEISEIARKYFSIPEDVVKKAELALKENLHYDKESGYKVPSWVK
ncbi:arylamine N-acetyltransferase [bacterium]|nr:arylamine N-acetyltransferase [bacterium]